MELYSPTLFSYKELSSAMSSGEIAVSELVDNVSEELENLFRIDFPFVAPGSSEYRRMLSKFKRRYLEGKKLKDAGVWVFFPWKNTAVHLVKKDDFFKLRTARNKFLITEQEQLSFYAAKVGVAGLSVGSSVVNSLVLSGGGGNMRIADFDNLSVVNLNRLHSSVCDLGRSKAIISARKVFELDPFSNVEVFIEGIRSENMGRFFGTGKDKLALFIEEIDDIKLKIDTRVKARQLRIPVVMATDNGDNTIVDVERFDLEPTRKLFHGKVDEEKLTKVTEKLSMAERVKLASAIVGSDITPRTRMSLTMVGSKLPAWPQLGNAATLSGVAVSYVARRIITGEDMPSGRYEVSLDENLDPTYFHKSAASYRETDKKEFVLMLNKIFGDL